MDVTTAARSLIGDTLAFHLIFVSLGVGLPLIISATELFGIWKKRPRARALARSWSRALVVLFIAGAVSGTLVSLQFSLLWPTFMALSGKVVGIAFALEGFAFLVEALFLSVYMLSWDRFKPWAHWLVGLPVVIGSMASAYFITSVNAWMNTPQGFSLDASGNPININVHKAIFNPAVGTETTHSILAYLLTAALVLTAVYAWLKIRRRLPKSVAHRLVKLVIALSAVSLIFGVAVGLSGDRSGKFIAKNEPYKLAAAEGLQQTQKAAPLLVGGIVKDGQVQHALRIPKLLSFLATGHLDGQVIGLNDIARDQRPPLTVHYFFDAMVGIGMILVILPAAYLLVAWRKARWAVSNWWMGGLVVCGVLAMLGIEFGWLLTEFGRQPYVVRGVLRTADAATKARSTLNLAGTLPALYVVLFILTYFGLKRTVKPLEALDD